MYVIDTYQKQGIGKELLISFFNLCKAKGVTIIQTDSDMDQKLLNFYTGNGFKITGVNYMIQL